MPQTIPVPSYVSANAERGLRLYEEGRGGDGLKRQTVNEARDMVEGKISEDKVRRMGPWLRRHEGDLDAPKNSDPDDPGYPGAGLVAWLLWGGDADGNMRAAEWAERKVEQLDKEKKDAAGVDTLGNQKTSMTIEEINATLKLELDAIKVEASTNATKLGEVETLLKEATEKVAAFESLKAEHEKTVAALAEATAKLATLEAAAVPAEAKAAAIVAACSADPAAISPESPEAPVQKTETVTSRWKAMPEGKAKEAFFKANKQAIFAEMRNLSL